MCSRHTHVDMCSRRETAASRPEIPDLRAARPGLRLRAFVFPSKNILSPADMCSWPTHVKLGECRERQECRSRRSPYHSNRPTLRLRAFVFPWKNILIPATIVICLTILTCVVRLEL